MQKFIIKLYFFKKKVERIWKILFSSSYDVYSSNAWYLKEKKNEKFIPHQTLQRFKQTIAKYKFIIMNANKWSILMGFIYANSHFLSVFLKFIISNANFNIQLYTGN